MVCSRYKIIYCSPINNNLRLTLLDYQDMIETELDVNRLFNVQEVPWVRGQYTGYIPRNNISHSFSFKKLEANATASPNDIPFARYSAFEQTPNILNPDRGDYLEIYFGALSGSNIQNAYSAILKNCSIGSINKSFDLLNSNKIWSTYTIKYGECIPNVTSANYALSAVISGTPAFGESGFYPVGVSVGDPWLLAWVSNTFNTSSNGMEISISPSTELFNLSGFQSTIINGNIDIKCPFGRYIYLEEEEGGSIVYDNGLGSTTIPMPKYGLVHLGTYNGRPYWGVDDWVIQWNNTYWSISNDITLFEAIEDVAYPWLVSFWTPTDVVISGSIATVYPYVKATEFNSYVLTNVNTNPEMNVTMEVVDIGTNDAVGYQTALLTTLTSGSEVLVSLSDQLSATLYQNF